MPLRLILYFLLITPLLGILQIELGAFAPGVSKWGEPNGATYAFLVYATFALIGARLATGGAFFRSTARQQVGRAAVAAEDVMKYTVLAVVVNGAFCALTLGLFGGLSVLSGDVGKGEFRTSLGGLGAIAYLTLKWLAPAVFALACALYSMSGRPKAARILLFLVGALTFVIGLSWGFKTTAVMVLLPGFIVLFWFRKPAAIVLPACGGLAAIFLAFQLFDTLEGTIYDSAFQFLLARLTIFQGDISWFVWDLWRAGEEFPDYAITLLAAAGDRALTLVTGVGRESSEQWILMHYGSLLTYVSGYPVEGIEEGHSVTGTPFSEGIIAMGLFGIPVFGLLAGLVIGFVYSKIQVALSTGRPLSAALWSNYAVWCVLAWLNGGEIVQLFHISVITGMFASKVLLSMLVAILHVRSAPASSGGTVVADRVTG